MKIKFGINNPIKTVNDYVTEIRVIIDTLQNKPFGTTLLPPTVATSTTLASATTPLGAKPLKQLGTIVFQILKQLFPKTVYILVIQLTEKEYG